MEKSAAGSNLGSGEFSLFSCFDGNCGGSEKKNGVSRCHRIEPGHFPLDLFPISLEERRRDKKRWCNNGSCNHNTTETSERRKK